MKIDLENFKHHKKATFTIPDGGLVRIDGDNGTGKSTLLHAIIFALYGKMPPVIRVKQVTHWDEKSCKVTLECNKLCGCTVTRTCKPNTLRVTKTSGEKIEGDVAQSFIDDKMKSTFIEFVTGAYCCSEGSSVLSMTPTEQVKFIESFAFVNGDHEKKKLLLLTTIKQQRETTITLQGELNILHSLLMKRKSILPPAVPKEITEGQTPQSLRDKIKDVEEKIAKTGVRLEEQRSKLSILQKGAKQFEEAKTMISTLTALIVELEKNIKSVEKKLVDETSITDPILVLTKLLERQKIFIVNQAKIDSYNSFNESQTKGLKKRLLELEKKMPDEKKVQKQRKLCEEMEVKEREYSVTLDEWRRAKERLDVVQNTLFEFVQQIKQFDPLTSGVDVKNVKSVLEHLERIRGSLIAVVSRSTCYSCPGCKMSVYVDFNTNTLQKAKISGNKTSDQSLNQRLFVIDTIIEGLEDISDEPLILTKPSPPPSSKDIKKWLNEVDGWKREIETITTSLKNKPQKCPTHLEQDVSDGFTASGDEVKKTEEELSRLRGDLKANQTLDANLRDLNKKLASKKKELALVVGKSAPDDLKDFDSMTRAVSLSTQSLMGLNERLTKMRATLDSFAAYERWLENEKEMKDCERQLDEKKSESDREERKLCGYTGLMDACKEAEAVAVENILTSLNNYAKFYLDKMMDEPIRVRLSNIKDKGKGVKFALNTEVVFRGREISYHSLNNGFKERCELAFLLGMNDMINGKIVMLDECLSHVHSDSTTDILKRLGEVCDDKLILVVAHGAVEGVFDSVVELT